jgi:peptidoglycan hydrolase CwlO-like protein
MQVEISEFTHLEKKVAKMNQHIHQLEERIKKLESIVDRQRPLD